MVSTGRYHRLTAMLMPSAFGRDRTSCHLRAQGSLTAPGNGARKRGNRAPKGGEVERVALLDSALDSARQSLRRARKALEVRLLQLHGRVDYAGGLGEALPPEFARLWVKVQHRLANVALIPGARRTMGRGGSMGWAAGWRRSVPAQVAIVSCVQQRQRLGPRHHRKQVLKRVKVQLADLRGVRRVSGAGQAPSPPARAPCGHFRSKHSRGRARGHDRGRNSRSRRRQGQAGCLPATGTPRSTRRRSATGCPAAGAGGCLGPRVARPPGRGTAGATARAVEHTASGCPPTPGSAPRPRIVRRD